MKKQILLSFLVLGSLLLLSGELRAEEEEVTTIVQLIGRNGVQVLKIVGLISLVMIVMGGLFTMLSSLIFKSGPKAKKAFDPETTKYHKFVDPDKIMTGKASDMDDDELHSDSSSDDDSLEDYIINLGDPNHVVKNVLVSGTSRFLLNKIETHLKARKLTVFIGDDEDTSVRKSELLEPDLILIEYFYEPETFDAVAVRKRIKDKLKKPETPIIPFCPQDLWPEAIGKMGKASLIPYQESSDLNEKLDKLLNRFG